VNLQREKVMRKRILLRLLLHLHHHLLLLLLLQVQVLNPMQRNMFINIRMKCLLKIDVKFELPIYDGEVNAERLENWVRKMEFYYSVQ
jgi:hypothetical protein